MKGHKYPSTRILHIMKLSVLQPSENFKGLSYGDWAAVWSNWFMSKEVDNYEGQDILFLRGHVEYEPISESEGAMRYQDPDSFLDMTGNKGLKILEGTSIFIPITVSFNSIGGHYEGKLIENERDLRAAVNEDINNVRSMWATLKMNYSKKSSRIVPDLKLYRIESPLFKLTVPEDSTLNNLTEYPFKPGVHDAVTEGYFILLRKLPTSSYQFDFGAEGPGDYMTRSVYDITVYRHTRKLPKDVSA
jgi:hypothetical protein